MNEGRIHIQPGPVPTLTVFARCPVCEHEAHLVGAIQDWYDTTWTCCRCGDSWAGDQLMERPFVRGWRKHAIQKACRTWYVVTVTDVEAL